MYFRIIHFRRVKIKASLFNINKQSVKDISFQNITADRITIIFTTNKCNDPLILRTSVYFHFSPPEINQRINYTLRRKFEDYASAKFNLLKSFCVTRFLDDGRTPRACIVPSNCRHACVSCLQLAVQCKRNRYRWLNVQLALCVCIVQRNSQV